LIIGNFVGYLFYHFLQKKEERKEGRERGKEEGRKEERGREEVREREKERKKERKRKRKKEETIRMVCGFQGWLKWHFAFFCSSG
jgi:hypothetical protein